MKNQEHLFPHEQSLEAAQARLNAQLIHKGAKAKTRDPFQRKSSQLPEPTSIQVRFLRVERLADNTLWCKELCRTIPSTHRGEIDTLLLAGEIALQKDFFRLQ